MSRMESRYMALLGKMIVKYGAMSDLLDYTDSERDILRLAKTEYDFYHAHEQREAGVEPHPSIDTVQKSSVNSTGQRAKLSLKPTR